MDKKKCLRKFFIKNESLEILVEQILNEFYGNKIGVNNLFA